MVKVMHMLHSLDLEVEQEGSTVRYGRKWDVPLGTELILCVCSGPCLEHESCNDPAQETCDNCTREGTGVVNDIWVGEFKDIPARLIENEHEKRSRMYSGLRDSMFKAYGSWTDFSEASEIVVVTYKRLT